MSSGRVVGPVAWANVRGHRIPAALIALTLAACGGLLTFGLAAQAASGNAFDRLWRKTNGADLWLYLNAGRVTAQQVDDALAQRAEVRAWTHPQLQAAVVPTGIVQSGLGTGLGTGAVLRAWPADPRAVGHPVVVAGRAPTPTDRDVVLVDLNVARGWRLAVGDTLGIPTPAGVRTLRIIGLDANAENCPAPLCGPQALYVAPGHMGDLGLLSSTSPGQLAVAIQVAHATPARVAAARDAITAALPAGSISFAWAAAASRSYASLGYATQAGLLLVFAAVAALASALLIVVAIGGAVRSDSRRIGLLKAVGFSAWQLRLSLLAEYAGLAAVGAVSGAAVASVLAPRVLVSVARQYGAQSPGIPWWPGLLTVLTVTTLTAVVVLLASRRSVRLDAVSALRSDATGGHGADALLPGPLVLSRAVGEISASRGRSALTGVALTVAAGSLVMSVLFAAGLGVFVDRLAVDGARTGDLVVRTSERLPAGRTVSLLRSEPEVLGVVMERNVNFTLPGSTDTLSLRLRSGDMAALPQSLVSGRELRLPGDVVVGFGLARRHHLRVGDDLSIEVRGAPRMLHVVGVNREINNLGQMATTLFTTVPDVRPFDQPLYLVHLRPGTHSAAVADRIASSSGGLIQPTVVDAGILPPTLRSIRPVINALAAVLALLTALGVFNAVLLGVQERRREFGLVRAIGMSRRQVLAIAISSTSLLAIAACAIAVPLAAVGGSALLNTVQSSIGIGPMNAPIPMLVLAVGPVVLVVAVLGALGPAWSASRTSVTATMRDL